MNKKGVLPVVAIFGLIGVAGIILLLGFSAIFSSFKFVFFGVLMLGLGAWALTSIKDTRTKSVITLLLIGGGIFMIFGGSLIQQTFTALSISNVDITPDGSRILVYAVSGGGQALSITFNPSTINPFIRDEGYAITKSSTLTAEYVESNKKFPFTTDQSETYAIKGIRKAGQTTNAFGSALTECKKTYPNSVTAVFTGKYQYLVTPIFDCYESYANGFATSFTGTGSGGWKIRFNLDGETKELTDSSQSITMASGQAKIYWQGNLLDINEVNSPSAFSVYHAETSWKLVDGNAVPNINNALTNFKSCVGSYGIQPEKFNQCILPFNSVVADATKDRSSSYISSSPNIEGISFTTGNMLVNLKTPVFKPTFTIELDASKVGIIKLSGTPDITSCIQDTIFDVAGSKSLPMKVKNIGTSDGFFEISGSCNNPEYSVSPIGVDVKASEEKSLNLLVSGGNSETSTNMGSCTIIAKDRNSGKTDSCGFDLEVEYNSGIQQCSIEGEKQCSVDGKTLFICTNGNFIAETCTDSCSILDGEPQCVSELVFIDNTIAECNKKAETTMGKVLGYEIVEKETRFLFFKTEKSVECRPVNLPLFIMGLGIIGLIVAIVFMVRSPRAKIKQ